MRGELGVGCGLMEAFNFSKTDPRRLLPRRLLDLAWWATFRRVIFRLELRVGGKVVAELASRSDVSGCVIGHPNDLSA